MRAGRFYTLYILRAGSIGGVGLPVDIVPRKVVGRTAARSLRSGVAQGAYNVGPIVYPHIGGVAGVMFMPILICLCSPE